MYNPSAHKNKDTSRGYSGSQPGDPVRGRQAILKAVESEKPALTTLAKARLSFLCLSVRTRAHGITSDAR